MPVDEVCFELEEHVEKAISFLKSEFRGVRTGRAHSGLVEHIKVDYYGAQSELRQLAQISTPEASLIMIKPFDPSSIKAIDKAITSSDLGLNPQSDGKVLRLNIPALSGERRQQLVGQVKSMAEQAKVAARNARRDANKQLDLEQKNKVITEDEQKSGKEETQKLTDKCVEQIDELLKQKSEEIMEV